MAYACSMYRVPRVRTYAEALAHFESVKPTYASGAKPIKGEKRRDNMQMRRHPVTGDVIFRLYHTDCVTYRTDGSIVIEGYASISTNAFIAQLTPDGIYQLLGLKGEDDPLLWLRGKDYRACTDALLVRARHPVVLDYDAAAQRWLPADPAELEPFTWKIPDRAKARAAMRPYHLSAFLAAAPALAAIGDIGRRYNDIAAVLEALQKRDFVTALRYSPEGEGGTYGYNRPGAVVCTRFVDELRFEIYTDADAWVETAKPIVTMSEYERWKKAQRRGFC